MICLHCGMLQFSATGNTNLWDLSCRRPIVLFAFPYWPGGGPTFWAGVWKWRWDLVNTSTELQGEAHRLVRYLLLLSLSFYHTAQPLSSSSVLMKQIFLLMCARTSLLLLSRQKYIDQTRYKQPWKQILKLLQPVIYSTSCKLVRQSKCTCQTEIGPQQNSHLIISPLQASFLLHHPLCLRATNIA